MLAHGPTQPELLARPVAAVLLVDDDAAKRLALRAMLEPLDVEIVEVDSGRSALRAVLRQTFAVILMDVRMPTLDGFETASLIRQRGDLARTPIVFVTAYREDEIQTAKAYAGGAVDFVFIPVLPEVLRAKVSGFVRLHEQSEELRDSLESTMTLNRALRNSEARARAVLDNVADGIVTVGADGIVTSFSRSAQRMFGYAEAEVIGQPLDFLIAEGHRDGIFSDSARAEWSLFAANDAPTEPIESVACRQDGSVFFVEATMRETQIDERTFVIVALRDISGRKDRAERERKGDEAARQEAQRMWVAFDEAPTGGVITDPDGRIVQVNRAFGRIVGVEPGELVGRHFLEMTHPDDRAESSTRVQALTESGNGPVRFTKRYVRSDGNVVSARVAVSVIRDDEKQPVQIYAQIEDTTETQRTRDELDQAQFEILARLAAAAEFHDDDTSQHTHRVGALSVAVANALGLPVPDAELLRFAAPLHDIGKLAIPDAVLGKRGKLTPAEFEQMKTHAAIGATMLSGSPFALVNMAEEIALSHHEKWDGSGYPHGLAGDAIPITGRIVAVADVFDALTHARPYKPAWSAEEAIAEMTDQAGRHFDPDVLEAFLGLGSVVTGA